MADSILIEGLYMYFPKNHDLPRDVWSFGGHGRGRESVPEIATQ